MIPKNIQFTCFISNSEMPNYPVISRIKTSYVLGKIYLNLSLSFDVKIIIWQKRVRIGASIMLYNE
ncbi:MAG: hypothetical protein ABIK77_06775 [candidate division WOR-3 bacterium]